MRSISDYYFNEFFCSFLSSRLSLTNWHPPESVVLNTVVLPFGHPLSAKLSGQELLVSLPIQNLLSAALMYFKWISGRSLLYARTVNGAEGLTSDALNMTPRRPPLRTGNAKEKENSEDRRIGVEKCIAAKNTTQLGLLFNKLY